MNVYLPRNLEDLWNRLDEERSALVFAGGTDLFVKMRAHKPSITALVGLERIEELRYIHEEASIIRIGAVATHAELLGHRLIATDLPVLAQALRMLGSPQIRNMGTIGGNICTASPAGDTLPPLYILQAEVELRTRETIRFVPINAFIIAPGQTQLQKGEIVTAVRVIKPEGYNIQRFEKVGLRTSMACAVASMAAMLHVSPSGVIEAARLAWGSVGSTVITATAVEEALIGAKLSQKGLAAAAERIRQCLSPIDDLRASADYRRTVSGNLLMRLL